MAKTKLIIEMGSSNTVIYKVGYGIVLREPSIVVIKNGKNEAFEVGIKAKKMLGKTDDSLRIIEPIQNGIIVDENSAKLMLKAFLNKITDKFYSKTDAVFCVSTGLTDNDLLLYKSVAYGCNISEVNFINVCLSGLLGAGVSVDKASAVMCVNLGGGTCNFGIVSLSKVIEGFSVTFGGIDMDKAIMKYAYNVHNMEISLSMAEKIKNECGSLYVQDTTNMEVLGVDCDTKRPVTEIFTSTEIRDVIIDYFENITACIEHLLSSCSADVIGDVSLNGIVVVGGVANIVGLENYLSKKLGLQIIIPDTPENCSVLGANSL